MKSFAKGLSSVEEAITVIIFMVLTLDVFVGVIWRYVLNNSIVWSGDLSRLLFVWLTWLGLSVGEAHKEHIKITMVTDRLPFRVQYFVLLLADIITIAIAVITAYNVLIVIQKTQSAQYVTMHLPYAVGYYSVPVGILFYVIRLLCECVKFIKYVIKGKSALSLDDIEVPAELAGVMTKEDYLAMLQNQKGGSDK